MEEKLKNSLIPKLRDIFIPAVITFCLHLPASNRIPYYLLLKENLLSQNNITKAEEGIEIKNVNKVLQLLEKNNFPQVLFIGHQHRINTPEGANLLVASMSKLKKLGYSTYYFRNTKKLSK